MRTALIPLLLTGALALAACSADATREVELPEEPSGVTILESEAIETPVDTIALAVQEASGSQAELTRLLDLGDVERADVIAHYDEALTELGWERQDYAVISRSLGATWAQDDRTLVLALVTVADTEVGILLQSPQG